MTTTTSLINIIVLPYYELQRVSILISCVVVCNEQHSIDNYQNYFYTYVMFLTSLLNILQKCNNLFRWNYSLKQVYMGITRFHIIKSESNIGPNYCKKRNWRKLKTRYLCAIIFLSLFLCVCAIKIFEQHYFSCTFGIYMYVRPYKNRKEKKLSFI